MAPFDSMPLYAFDVAQELKHSAHVVGIDEAGRGPLAGPVVAAAVVLDLNNPISSINDSKKVRPQKRDFLYDEIAKKARAWAVASASPEEIDKYNILQATFMAMKRALDTIGMWWSLVLVDGNQYIASLPRTVQKPVIKGDGLSASIAAASIMAKVTRDRIMTEYHREYPEWDFHVHKGYATQRHRDLIGRLGLCGIHRKSFCGKFLKTGQNDIKLGNNVSVRET
ncbi:MAG: ribonuclease HII [Chitinivibrionales bacterium]